MAYTIPTLPFETDLETKAVMKKIVTARSALAELKGAATGIPNENILISTLSLQEAKDSSAIENIITTHDELYQSDFNTKNFKSLAAKEVHSYAQALRTGFETVKQKGFISNTAAKYLDELEKIGIVSKHKIWKDNYYVNDDLFNLLANVGK